jgi:hypothetical protein
MRRISKEPYRRLARIIGALVAIPVAAAIRLLLREIAIRRLDTS